MAVVNFTKRPARTGSNGSSMENLPARAETTTSTHRTVQNERHTLFQGLILLANGAVTNLSAAERFRILRAKIERHNLGSKQANVIAITSALPQEGKSVVAVNLARALSIDPLGKTLLIDCDLRRPTVHQFFNTVREPGFSDALLEGKISSSMIRAVSPTLDLLTAGTLINDPAHAIEQPLVPQFLEVLRKRYRYVIIDCPPALLCPEPILLSSVVDTTLLVVRAWSTSQRLVRDAVDVIGKSKIMGVVMNDGTDSSRHYMYYGYYGYAGELKREMTRAASAGAAPSSH